eukprot:m.82080 g.82080  ORF g.82080 m.82080 type:complete len:59 (+) comp8661_c1_seq6:353-529(+)
MSIHGLQDNCEEINPFSSRFRKKTFRYISHLTVTFDIVIGWFVCAPIALLAFFFLFFS